MLENISNILEAAGLGLKNVVKTTVFLKDAKDFSAMNDLYKQYSKDPPARTTVGVTFVLEEMLVEIEAIAYIPEKR